MPRTTTYMEFRKGTAHKFFLIQQDGNSVSVTRGRVGTRGRVRSITMPTVDQTVMFVDREIWVARNTGYEIKTPMEFLATTAEGGVTKRPTQAPCLNLPEPAWGLSAAADAEMHRRWTIVKEELGVIAADTAGMPLDEVRHQIDRSINKLIDAWERVSDLKNQQAITTAVSTAITALGKRIPVLSIAAPSVVFAESAMRIRRRLGQT